MSTSGLNFENIKSLKTIGSGALSGALSTANRTTLQVSSHSSIKNLISSQPGLNKLKHGLFSTASKKNLNEESGFQSGSLEEKETSYQRSKNSSSSFNRGVKDNTSSKEASLENILEQDDDVLELNINQATEEDVSLQQVDVDFERDNRLRNSNTLPGKKTDKKYTTSKNTAASSYLGSIMTKKNASNLSYQIPVARKS